MAEDIRVKTPHGDDYDIVIQPGALDDLTVQQRIDTGGQYVVISNTTVAPLYADHLMQSPLNAELFTVPDGEEHKNLDTVARLYTNLTSIKLDRAGTIIALGGGVLGDTAGFVAATYLRGVRLIQVPTSLLSMVDSSVGGKVGVDLPQGKNLVGAFKQPALVVIDPDVLESLPAREWRCGMAEVLKHGLLADPVLLDPVLHTRERAAELIRRAVQVKVDVVQRDPFEQGERAHLNLGHTFAHAIEQVTGYRWPHGEAVGVGLLAAAKLSHKLGMLDAAVVEQVDTVLAAVGLPRTTGDLHGETLYAAMQMDKKWRGGKSRFVLLRGIGQPEVVYDVDKNAVIEVLREIK